MGTGHFTFFESYAQAMDCVSDEEFGKAVRALCRFVFNGIEPECDDPFVMIFVRMAIPIVNSQRGAPAGNQNAKKAAPGRRAKKTKTQKDMSDADEENEQETKAVHIAAEDSLERNSNYAGSAAKTIEINAKTIENKANSIENNSPHGYGCGNGKGYGNGYGSVECDVDEDVVPFDPDIYDVPDEDEDIPQDLTQHTEAEYSIDGSINNDRGIVCAPPSSAEGVKTATYACKTDKPAGSDSLRGLEISPFVAAQLRKSFPPGVFEACVDELSEKKRDEPSRFAGRSDDALIRAFCRSFDPAKHRTHSTDNDHPQGPSFDLTDVERRARSEIPVFRKKTQARAVSGQ